MTTIAETIFLSSDGLEVQRVSTSAVSVRIPGVPSAMRYPLPLPRSRGRGDLLEVWQGRVSEMTAEGSIQRMRAIVEFIVNVEPDQVTLVTAA